MISAGGFRRALGWVEVATLAAALLILLAPAAVWAGPADLDPSFGEGGHAAVQVNAACLRGCVELAGSYADTLALQPNGGIVVGGHNEYIGARSGFAYVPGALVRLLSNGALDTSFGGTGGIDNTPFAVTDIRVNARGGLVASGEMEGRTGIQRYTVGGVLDGFYGSNGVRWLPGQEAGQRDSRGRYLAFVTVVVPATDYAELTTRLDVRRRLPSGRRDVRFGHRGYVSLPGSKAASPLALAIEPNGGVIVAFESNGRVRSAGPSLIFIERLTPTGKLDRAFGERGIAHLQLRGEAGDARMTTRNGHVFLAVGERRGTRILQGEEGLTLADYTRGGRLDQHFGNGGIAHSKFTAGARYSGVSPRAIAFDAHGDLIVVGQHHIRTTDTPAGDGFLARYTPEGRDCSFGAGGLAVDDGLGAASAVAVQPNGRIVVAGGLGRFLAARFMGGGTPRVCPGEPHSRRGT